jgi:hypothetical protein
VSPWQWFGLPSDSASAEGLFGAENPNSSGRGSVSGVPVETAVWCDRGSW